MPRRTRGYRTQILEHGLLAARFWGRRNDAKGAAIEADHLHNLPSLLQNYSRSKLEWYWEAERPNYIEAHLSIGDSQTGF